MSLKRRSEGGCCAFHGRHDARTKGLFPIISRKNVENLEKLIVTGTLEGRQDIGRYPIKWSDLVILRRD